MQVNKLSHEKFTKTSNLIRTILSVDKFQLINKDKLFLVRACVCIFAASRETCMRRDLTVDFHNPRLEIEILVKK